MSTTNSASQAAAKSSAKAQQPSIIGRKMDFKLQNQDGVEIAREDLAGRRCLVFFYPRAMTPGCTKQNCELSAMAQEFAAAKIILVGISPDSPEKLAKFKAAHGLEHLLLSDADHAVAEQFGAWGLKKNYGREYEGLIRSAFLLSAEGVCEREWRNHKAAGFAARVAKELLAK